MHKCSRLCCFSYLLLPLMWLGIGMILESEANTASSSLSQHTPVNSSPPDKVHHKRKRKRRRRIRNDALLNDNDDSESIQPIIEKTSNTSTLESAAVSSSSSPMLSSLPSSQETIAYKKKHRKSRRRRKEVKDTTIKDDVLLSLSPNSTTPLNTTSSNHKLVQSMEELENNTQINRDGDNNAVSTDMLNNGTIVTNNDKDECVAVKTDDVLLSQSQSNATNIAEEIKSAQESVSSVKATEKKQNTAKNKKKTQSNKKQNASKSTTTTTTTSTGKEGECLRRIKHEWKNAVKSGIAYDWINMKTIRNTNTTNSAYVRIGPFGKNLLRWHFSVAGPANSVYENGIYHGRVLLPKDYPASPPRVQMITPSGRFIPGEDICLSASSYHPETWSPRWTVLSLVDALRLHMLTTANEIGGVLASDEKRRQYATESRSWKCHGVVNHERMVADNIFALDNLDSGGEDDDGNECKEEANSDESNIVKSDDMSDKMTRRGNKENSYDEVINDPPPSPSLELEKDAPKGKKKRPTKSPNKAKKKRKQKSIVTSVVETGEGSTQCANDAKDETPTTRTSTEKNSSSKKKKSTGTGKQSTDKASSTRTSTKEKTRSHNRATDIQVQENNQSILTIVLKRLLVEILKLPLRVLAILIRILNRFEIYMRAILDGI